MLRGRLRLAVSTCVSRQCINYHHSLRVRGVERIVWTGVLVEATVQGILLFVIIVQLRSDESG